MEVMGLMLGEFIDDYTATRTPFWDPRLTDSDLKHRADGRYA